MKTILVAGASGFIGQALVEQLLEDPDVRVIALSRRARPSSDSRVVWKKCDLYSLKDVKEAMDSIDCAYYLVHSMIPSAGLTQGTFYDFDLIMADNFVRAATQAKIQRIVYLGGLIPADKTKLSWHLRSRLEVEKTLRTAPCDVITLRAGLIVGKEGSSFVILRRLVERLPIMILPSWTSTLMEPIALPDVIRILKRALRMPVEGRSQFDIGGKEKIAYGDLIVKAATILRRNVKTYPINFISIRLSRFWITLVTGVSKSLVYPLVLSLKHEMLVSPDYAWPHPEDIQVKLDEALVEALSGEDMPKSSPVFTQEHDVRSVQRMTLPQGKTAEWVSSEYFRWLPSILAPLIRVNTDGNTLSMRILGLPWTLLILEKSTDRSTPDRQLLYIRGGLLVKNIGRGRLEFREVLDRKYVMAAIHEYRPSLPWFLYVFTQARFHIWVMKAFGRHLKHV